MHFIFLPLIALAFMPAQSVMAGLNDTPILKRWSPAVRSAPERPIAQWPCDRLAEVKPSDERKHQQLRQRKQRCMKRYQNFLPKTGLR